MDTLNNPASTSEKFLLNESQKAAMAALKKFLKSKHQIFILNGAAGTGKTTLVKSLCNHLKKQNISFNLTATTGRAAKVLSSKAGHNAITVHSLLYFFDEVSGNAREGEDPWESETGQLYLNFGLRSPQVTQDEPHPEVIIVDEASMLSHMPSEGIQTARFGSGCLLNDLLEFAGITTKLIFVGDNYQLPPVSDSALSAALSQKYWLDNSKTAELFTLNEIVRQEADNEILQVATHFRKQIQPPQSKWLTPMPVPMKRNFFTTTGSHEFFEAFFDAVNNNGVEQSVAICHSNRHAHLLNEQVRKKLHGKTDLQVGDLLMVIQNSYCTNLVNGDQVTVEEVSDIEYRAGFHFIEVKVKSLFSNQVYDTLLIQELLYNTQPGLEPDEVKRLLIDFDQRMKNRKIKRNSGMYKDFLRKDIYVNALRAKFGYALTVHKAQGGEWNNVFLYLHNSIFAPVYDRKKPNGRHPDGAEKYHRWFYTAVTRAKVKLVANDCPLIKDFQKRNPQGEKEYWKAIQREKQNYTGSAKFAQSHVKGKVVNILNQNEQGVNGFIKVEGLNEKIYFILGSKNPIASQIKIGSKVNLEIMPAKNEKGPKATRIKLVAS